MGIGTLGAAPGVSTGSTEAKGTTSGVGRGEGTTAAVEAGAALVFPVTLGSSGGASLAAHFLAAGLRHWPGMSPRSTCLRAMRVLC